MSQTQIEKATMKRKGGPSSAKPSWLGRVIVYFPSLHLSFFLFSLYGAYLFPHFIWPVEILAVIYLFPLLCYRVHNYFHPLLETRDIIPNGKYPPWWGSYHIQFVFISIPWLETPLRFVPGLYSTWLRAWGSKIGKKIIWPPMLELVDRGLLEIGDGTVIGMHSGYYCHILNPTKDGRVLLYVKKIKIGSYCFIGSGSRLGPGIVIPDRTKLDVLTDLSTDLSQKKS